MKPMGGRRGWRDSFRLGVGQLRPALQGQFGKATPWVVILGVFFIVASSVVADAFLTWFKARFAPWWAEPLVALALLAIMGSAAILLRGAPSRLRVRRADQPCTALVMFLSWPQDVGAAPDISELPIDGGGNRLDAPQRVDLTALSPGHPFRSWRMPLQALRHHEGSLRDVALITSADSCDGRYDGSFRCVDLFRQVVSIESHGSPVVVVSLEEHGTDFEDIEDLDSAIQRAIDWLLRSGHRRRGLVVDITGGKASCSAVGAMRALDQDLRFEYVSTTDYVVRPYDVEREDE